MEGRAFICGAALVTFMLFFIVIGPLANGAKEQSDNIVSGKSFTYLDATYKCVKAKEVFE